MNLLTLDQLQLQPEDRVLEVGFGGGELLGWILGRTSGQAFGLDASEAMVRRARRRLGGSGRLRLFHGSVETIPLPDASIDKACSVNNIYFWPDPNAAMAELARVIRTGGMLAISFEPAEELRKWPGHRFGFRLYSEEEVAGLMNAAGFGSIRSVEGTGRKPDRFLLLSGERLGANG
jgi:ubiquinone/menaquinone biosynthesis C-methylase UbiE